jgi:uncharacterized protein YkwD
VTLPQWSNSPTSEAAVQPEPHPEPRPEPQPEGGLPPQPARWYQRLGPVGLAAVGAALLAVLGVAAIALPALFSGDSHNTAAGAAPALPAAPLVGSSAAPSAPSADDSPEPSPAATSAKATVKPTTPAPVAGNARFEDQVVALVNNERRRARCEPLRVDEHLRTAARAHSADMATNNFVNHTGTDHSSPDDRMRAAGYGAPLSEDLARGPGSPQDVVRTWMHDRGDQGNLLNCDAKAAGVGVAVRGKTPFWTIDLGR